MSNFARAFIMAALICCMVMTATYAAAYSVAVLPVADLTQGHNGVNFDVTAQLEEQLRQQGLDVVEASQVIKFMSQYGLRRCGEIDSFSCRKMADGLKCDSLLLATISSRSKTADQTSLLLTLLHGKNGQPVWSTIGAGHLNDVQPLFGISANREIAALQNQLIHTLVQRLVQELPTLPEVRTRNISSTQIADIRISPPLVQGGQAVNCRLKIYFLGSEPDILRLNSGEHATILHRTTIPHLYAGTFTSAIEEGSHSIDLSLRWLSQKEKKITNLGSYHVANRPAQLILDFHTGLKLGDTLAFSDSIKVTPRMKPLRPVDLWNFTVYDKQGNIVFTETQHTALPAEMCWYGTDNNRRRIKMGYYTLSFTVCDIAGNEAQVISKLYLQSTDAEMIHISQHLEQGKRQLKILPAEDLLIPIDNWALTLETEEGVSVFTEKGVLLPAIVTIPAEISQQGLICHFRMLDKLGNHYTLADTRLQTTSATGILAQRQPQKIWKADF